MRRQWIGRLQYLYIYIYIGEIGKKSQGRPLGKSVYKNWNLNGKKKKDHCCLIPIFLYHSKAQATCSVYVFVLFGQYAVFIR